MRGSWGRAWVLTGLLAAGGALTACDLNIGDGEFSLGVASGRASDEWSRTYDLSAGGRLEIVNVNGLVQVEPADGDEVVVRAERRAKGPTDEDAQALLEKVQIAEDVSADRVRLETKAPKTWGRSGVEVRYYIKVPANVRVNARTNNGGIKLKDVANELEVRTTNGGVDGENLGGPVKASTTNGGISLRFSAVSGDVEAGTVNGGVSLRLPRQAKATLDVSVVNGGISMGDLPVEADQQSRRRFQGTMNGGGPRIELETTNGGIRVAASE
jgi:DUF4097 and DUF4098 domain-containing protein YvlB